MRGLVVRSPVDPVSGEPDVDAGDKPFVLDNGQIRYLYFSFDFIQSAMLISDPDALDLRYTQKMMAFLLFNPDPAHVAVIGLGGGSIVKYCYRRLAGARLTAVEISPDILALRGEFCIPADDARLRIVEGDGARFVADHRGAFDALIVDAYDRDGIAPTLASRRFVEDALDSLAPGGVLVFNLAGPPDGLAPVVSAILDVFGERALAMQVGDDEHHILLAFRDGPFPPPWREVAQRARGLRAALGLDFPVFARKLEQGMNAQLAWKLAHPGLAPDLVTLPGCAGSGRPGAGRGDRHSGKARKTGKRRQSEHIRREPE